MRRVVAGLSILAVTATLTACGPGGLSNQQGGTLTGGVLGGVLGSQVGRGDARTAAIIGATLLGGYLGSRVGRNMDQTDQMRLQQSMNSSQQSSWHSSSGQNYSVSPNKTYIASNGQMCRNFTLRDSSGTTVNGTSCCTKLSSNGTCSKWVIVK